MISTPHTSKPIEIRSAKKYFQDVSVTSTDVPPVLKFAVDFKIPFHHCFGMVSSV
jgi:hypothetical protein